MLVLAVAATFWSALGNDFVHWDDDTMLTGNSWYRGLSPSHLRWMFTTFHNGHYQPLTWVTFALDYLFWGMNPVGYHLTSVVLHAVAAVVFWRLAVELLGRALRCPDSAALRGAALVAALVFAVHPLRVESVAWVSERRDVLSGLFYILSVLAYVRAADAPAATHRRRLAVSVGCFLLSLFSKAWAITLPVALLVLDWYPLRRHGVRRLVLEKVPYAVPAAAGALLALASTRTAWPALAEHGVVERCAQAAYGLVFYPVKTLFPTRLSPLYLLEKPLDPTSPVHLACVLAVTAITLAAVVLARRRPWLLASWAYYVVTVSPVLGLVQAGQQKVADRYSYLGCLPWALLAGAGMYPLWVSRRVPRPLLLAGATAWVAVLAVLAAEQTRVWRDSMSVWNRVVEVEPRNYFGLTNRGMARQVTTGDRAGALADYDLALAANPDYPVAHNNRGLIRVAQGDVQGGTEDYTAALRINPQYASAYANRAAARERLGDRAGAMQDYSEAVRWDAELARAWYGRGNLRAALGDVQGAIADYDAVLRIQPDSVEALNNRANARRVLGDARGAIADLERALALTPPGTPAHGTIAQNLELLRAGARP